jgi:site-specific DNA-methyltransferase (adenine-specific)
MLKLLHGDCLELMQDIPDKSIDAIITDPPYGTTACKWDAVIPFEPMWKELNRIIKDNGAIVLFGSQPFTSALVMSNPKMFKYEWIWDKVKPSGFQIAKYRPMTNHEHCVVFSKSTPNYYPITTPRDKIKKNSFQSKSESSPLQKHDGKERIYDSYLPKSILTISNANQRNRIHPTQKPIQLMEYLVKTYTNENETVLDFTMGSGTTGVACKNLNRNFIGIEKDDNYFKIATDRINA